MVVWACSVSRAAEMWTALTIRNRPSRWHCSDYDSLEAMVSASWCLSSRGDVRMSDDLTETLSLAKWMSSTSIAEDVITMKSACHWDAVVRYGTGLSLSLIRWLSVRSSGDNITSLRVLPLYEYCSLAVTSIGEGISSLWAHKQWSCRSRSRNSYPLSRWADS